MVVSGSLCQCALHACVPAQHNPQLTLLRALVFCPAAAPGLTAGLHYNKAAQIITSGTSDTQHDKPLGQRLGQPGLADP